ncbi:thiamine diphosphate-binding protein [Melanogaster broomeanus]|nr:thiamine diphosphate-binding protein [Melanogaster broomeanus]
MLSRQAIRRFPYTLRATAAPAAAAHRALATPAAPPSPNDPFANGTERLLCRGDDPKSVHASWDAYFSGMDHGLPSAKAFQPPPGSNSWFGHTKFGGHHVAELDPLGILDADLADVHPPELELSRYGFTERDLDKQISLGPGILPHFATEDRKTMSLRDIIKTLKRIYCGAVGIQYVHIPDKEQVEIPKPWNYTLEEKRMILDPTHMVGVLRKVHCQQYPNEKRFGLEGCEALIPGMKALIDRSVDHGVKHVTMGMPHRGRLNVLANVIRKPIEAILNEFSGSEADDSPAGDVKYHLEGLLSLVANPSHRRSRRPSHAAFAGQGVVYETMGFHNLPNYGTGGTIHLIVNNQIGFTTDPRFARSTPYPSDIAKSIDAPIFHVNGDNVEAVNFVCQLAADYRAKYKRDVVIDIAIEKQPTPLTQYSKFLVGRGTFTEKDIEEHKKWVWGMLEKPPQLPKITFLPVKEWLSASWQGFPSPRQLAEETLPTRATGSDEETVKRVGKAISQWPAGFTPHRNLSRILATRGKTVEEGRNIDWSTAEALAFGSLALEKVHVRVSGQDVERGTFSQRHAVIHDQVNEQQYVPLNDLGSNQARFVVCNSSLSEYGTLGFELGYSLVSPNSLTIWEAQFGDFANNAQCIIDQFIAAGERKWLQRSGLVMSLPHGYDGQGPEHSSGRIERFLQLFNCFLLEIFVAHPRARSDLSEMIGDTHFQRYLPDSHPESLLPPEQIRRHILCTGQVYHTLLQEREEKGIKDVVISRIEQLSPFPYDLITPHLDKYPNADLLWCQVSISVSSLLFIVIRVVGGALNNGAWTYIGPRILTAANETQYP